MNTTRLSKEEFCEKFKLTEEQFYGKIFYDYLSDAHLEYLPEGCSLKNYNNHIYLNSLIELPEGCSLTSYEVNLYSLKYLPEDYSIDAHIVTCNIILPTSKRSSDFFYGEWSKKRSFKKYSYIKESPLKYIRSDEPLEVALAEYFLKEST